MKKLVVVFLITFCGLTFFGCGGAQRSDDTSQQEEAGSGESVGSATKRPMTR